MKILLQFFAVIILSGCGLRPVKLEPEITKAFKQYWFVMLTKGVNRDAITDSVEISRIQAGHMAHMKKMAEDKKLVMAGPFGDDGNWRGIFIFDVKIREEVVDLLKQDPAIASGRLDYEIHPWWSESGTVLP